VRKTTIQIDDELFEEARQILGTKGLKATVHAALREIVAQDARERVIEQLRTMDGLDLDKPEVMARAWRR
jgi:Arc/MetJ family transcription regulator